jgi:hypothetical protein
MNQYVADIPMMRLRLILPRQIAIGVQIRITHHDMCDQKLPRYSCIFSNVHRKRVVAL